jgi:replicative DNA helicase
MNAPKNPHAAPRDLDTERGYLGSCLIAENVDRQREMLDLVTAEDLWSEHHREVWGLMRRMSQRGLVDLPGMFAEAMQSSTLDRLGGPEVLTTLGDHAVHSALVESYATRLRDLGRRRAVIEHGLRLATLAGDTAVELDQVEKAISAPPADSRAAEEGRWHDPEAVALAMMEDAIAAHEAGRPVRRERFPLGIPTLDQRLHLGRGQVAVVAGRPSMGKSALAQQWAMASARRGFSVVYISLEMPARLIAERHAAQLYGVPWREYATRAPTAQEVASISMAARDWADLGIRVDDRPGPTVDQLARALRTAHRRRPIDLFVIDHIGLVSLGRASRYEGMTAVSNGLLALAKELNAGAILLSQLSRAHTGRAGSDAGIPRLSDLRDSGAVEQDADIVVGVWRPSMDNPEDPAPDVLSVLKDRSGGSISRVPSLFDGPRQLWTERDLTRPDDGEDW